MKSPSENHNNYPCDQGTKLANSKGMQEGKNPREVSPPDNPLLGEIPRKGEQEKTNRTIRSYRVNPYF